ncbi:MAG: ATP-dependent helicase, partial [Kiritimatiellae bacterium]|nr:ATP-dependent helicase [Kiritimatiellia bacterium]
VAAARLRMPVASGDAEDFIRRGARELREAGYGVDGADLAVEITAGAEVEADGKAPSFKLTVRVAGEPVTAEEIKFLLDQGSTLVCFRGRWIEVDRGILREALRALERGAGKKADPLGFALGLGHVGRLEISMVEVRGRLKRLVGELRAGGRDGVGAAAPEGFAGELREYQRRGVDWLRFLTGHGFGALLADDMGLGKTVQVIAWALACCRGRKLLVVAPLTLLGNWRHELERFAPGLKVYVHHGELRQLGSGFKLAVGGADVTLTSYTLLVRDYGDFSEIKWDAMAIDEAQAVKNPDTRVSGAVRALTPPMRIAVTGTPVENSLADLWALEEFLNPGLLGDRRSFAERFVKPVAEDERSSAGLRLRRALEPFILRRLKTDVRIAAELGDKREIREYCELTPEQRLEYEKELGGFRAAEHERGDVFALLTRLKLICDGAGKLERLFELVETIFANGESALVFTQYAKVGAWLRGELGRRFGREFPFLHGALAAKEREAQISVFKKTRGPGLFLLSLKAGGFGLNLVKATHVIHFDRWWNPAVENQATDRAHRIGQARTVFAHLFITAGTIEEHVDRMLLRKAAVADSVITEAEWLEAAELDG